MDFIYCRTCSCWVYAHDYVIETTEEGHNITMCLECLTGEALSWKREDLTYGRVQCIWCDSYDTVKKEGDTYECNECNETFRRIY